MIVIVDYGMGNLFSIQAAIRYVGGQSVISSDPGTVEPHQQVGGMDPLQEKDKPFTGLQAQGHDGLCFVTGGRRGNRRFRGVFQVIPQEEKGAAEKKQQPDDHTGQVNHYMRMKGGFHNSFLQK